MSDVLNELLGNGWERLNKSARSPKLDSLEILENSDGDLVFILDGVAAHLDNAVLASALIASKEIAVTVRALDEFKKGLRLEVVSKPPQHSGKNQGRLYFCDKDEKIYCDLGYKLKKIISERFEKDIQVSDPSEIINIDLSDSDIVDARKAIWQVCDNSEDFSRVNAKIKTPNEKSVVIELPEGSEIGTFRVLGVE